jgi:hypothetical protein
VVPATRQAPAPAPAAPPAAQTAPRGPSPAATAAAPASLAAVPPPAAKKAPQAEPVPATLEEKLETLKRLRDKGLIDKDEYQTRKQRLLDEYF